MKQAKGILGKDVSGERRGGGGRTLRAPFPASPPPQRSVPACSWNSQLPDVPWALLAPGPLNLGWGGTLPLDWGDEGLSPGSPADT